MTTAVSALLVCRQSLSSSVLAEPRKRYFRGFLGVGLPETAAGFLVPFDFPAAGFAEVPLDEVPETVFPVCLATVLDVAGFAGVGFSAGSFLAGAFAGGTGALTAVLTG